MFCGIDVGAGQNSVRDSGISKVSAIWWEPRMWVRRTDQPSPTFRGWRRKAGQYHVHCQLTPRLIREHQRARAANQPHICGPANLDFVYVPGSFCWIMRDNAACPWPCILGLFDAGYLAILSALGQTSPCRL